MKKELNIVNVAAVVVGAILAVFLIQAVVNIQTTAMKQTTYSFECLQAVGPTLGVHVCKV